MAASSRGPRLSLLLLFFVTFFYAVVEAQTEYFAYEEDSLSNLTSRALPQGQCSETEECWDKSCCSKTGWCGFGKNYCNDCWSNCKAKAECGDGADPDGKTCPLNVCCGQYGYCGTTEKFCTTGCQSNCDQPGPIGGGNGDVTKLVIGYWEGWSLTRRGCANRAIEDVPVAGLTHLNLAFGYIAPETYEIYPIRGLSDQALSDITNLKQRAPGLRIWLSLGGWTYSDNDTDTQAVWGDLASTASKRGQFIRNLVKFMKQWGFDGVDLDWEYPGAPDRGGKDRDVQNFVELMKDIRFYWDGQNTGWGLSFTAPTSYWYMRWFDIENLAKYTDWINLMTYDLHGSWDSPLDQIGSYVYAHTNLTEIRDALNLLWRNNVPASKVNLGIGFYGRSYTLEDPKCAEPGCPFKYGGRAGSCTGESGILSYDEIESMKKIYGYDSKYDEEAGAKYFAFDDDQWVSYDDAETLQLKVDFANQAGLLGLFIWAIDLDDRKHTALNALIGNIEKFKDQNGVGSRDNSDWEPGSGNECTWTDCGVTTCSGPKTAVGATTYCGYSKKDGDLRKVLCCPFGKAPKNCKWNIGGGSASLGLCSGSCPSGQLPVADSKYPVIDGKDAACLYGTAQFCCDVDKDSDKVCNWNTDGCFKKGDLNDKACPSGTTYLTSRRGHCSASKGTWEVLCCDAGAKTDSCYWNTGNAALWCDGASSCPTGYINEGTDTEGDAGNKYCRYTLSTTGIYQWDDADVSYCCKASDLAVTTVNLPVPLKNLFEPEDLGPDTDKQAFDVQVDRTMGGKKNGGNSQDPDDNSFGFYIMSGPEDQLTSLDKRSGSDWELYDCESEGEHRQTVRAVCLDESSNGNCHKIHLGEGVSGTVVEMPKGCGPGKYAMAVELKRSIDQSMPGHLIKRGVTNRTIYDFTFDYDFTVVEKRADKSKVLLRIDYSDDPKYWSNVVEPPGEKKKKRELEERIETEFDGNHKRWLEHSWHHEKRAMELDDLHKRWFSADIVKWYNKVSNVDYTYTGVRHSVHQTVQATLFDQSIHCPNGPLRKDAYLKAYSVLDINVDTSAGITLIGRLGNLNSWDESFVWVRSSGDIVATFVFDAYGKLSFHSGQVELFGLANFGAAFRIPGLVTIGPNLRVLAQLSGDASLHMLAQYRLPIKSWDYSQSYPPKDGEVPAKNFPKAENAVDKANPNPAALKDPFGWEIEAKGQLVAHVIPKITFGVEFDSASLASATIDFGADVWTRLYGHAGAGSGESLQACYGMDGGVKVFAAAQAPNMFGSSYNLDFPIWSDTWDIIQEKCYP